MTAEDIWKNFSWDSIPLPETSKELCQKTVTRAQYYLSDLTEEEISKIAIPLLEVISKHAETVPGGVQPDAIQGGKGDIWLSTLSSNLDDWFSTSEQLKLTSQEGKRLNKALVSHGYQVMSAICALHSLFELAVQEKNILNKSPNSSYQEIVSKLQPFIDTHAVGHEMLNLPTWISDQGTKLERKVGAAKGGQGKRHRTDELRARVIEMDRKHRGVVPSATHSSMKIQLALQKTQPEILLDPSGQYLSSDFQNLFARWIRADRKIKK